MGLVDRSSRPVVSVRAPRDSLHSPAGATSVVGTPCPAGATAVGWRKREPQVPPVPRGGRNLGSRCQALRGEQPLVCLRWPDGSACCHGDFTLSSAAPLWLDGIAMLCLVGRRT